MNPFSAAGLLADRSSQQVLDGLLSWQKDVFAALLRHKPAMEAEIPFMATAPLQHLPYEQQVHYMGRFRNIIGLDATLDRLARLSGDSVLPNEVMDRIGQARGIPVQNIISNLREMRPAGSSAPFYKFPTSYAQGGEALDAIYANLNLTFDEIIRPNRAGIPYAAAGRAGHHFSIGISSVPLINAIGLSAPTSLREGAKLMTFDIETAGLMQNQIREIAYNVSDVAAGGRLGAGSPSELLFSPRMFKRGLIGAVDPSGGRVLPTSLDAFLSSKYGYSIPQNADFAQNMVPFLEQMRSADYVMGHNIARFDIPQVFRQLANTEAYRSADQSIIPGFKDLVDQTFAGLENKVVDTLRLAERSANLTGIQVAPELLRRGEATPYSISNLLLETDLGERIGYDNLQKAMAGKGLHFGAVDDLVTRGLYQHLNDLQLKSLTGGPEQVKLRQAILASAAVTPTTNAASALEVTDHSLRRMVAAVDNGITLPMLAENEPLRTLLEQAPTNQRAADEAVRMIRAGNISGARFGINPVEQSVLAERNLNLGLPKDLSRRIDPGQLVGQSNLYDRLAYGAGAIGDYSSPIIGQNAITNDQFRKLQSQMASGQSAWAGLSHEERRFGNAIAHLTRGADNFSDLATDAMVGNFQLFDPQSLQYTTRSGRTTLPGGMMKEFLDANGKPALLGMSVVSPTSSNKAASINLVYKMESQAASEAFATSLRGLAANPDAGTVAAALGMDMSQLTDENADMLAAVTRFRTAVNQEGLADVIAKSGHTTGITVGQLTGERAQGVIGALSEISGMAPGELRDESMLKFALPFMGMSPDEYGRGSIRTTGTILNKFLSPDELKAVSSNVSHAKNVFDAYRRLGDPDNKVVYNAARAAAFNGGESVMGRVYQGYMKLRPNFGKVGLGALGALAAVGLWNRYDEGKQYRETLDRMPYEGGGRYGVADRLQAKMDAGIDKSYQRYDPLSTTYVVDEMFESRVNHSNMRWDKDTNLYGGVL